MKKFPYKATLFDMDGVVVDTKREVTSFWNDLASHWREPISEEEFDHYVYGCQSEYTLDILFPFLNDEMRFNVLKELEESESNAIYHEVEGFKQFISVLKKHQVITALVTSGLPHKVDAVLQQLKLEGVFDRITTAKEISNSKPDPQCYSLTIKSIGVDSKDCIIFEDAISGVNAAIGSGADCIGINKNKNMLMRLGTKAVFNDFRDDGLYQFLQLK